MIRRESIRRCPITLLVLAFVFTAASAAALALSGADPTVPIDTVSNSGSGSVECFNCATARLITSGDLALAAVPTIGTLGRAAFAVLLVLAVAWTLRRRAHLRTAGHA